MCFCNVRTLLSDSSCKKASNANGGGKTYPEPGHFSSKGPIAAAQGHGGCCPLRPALAQAFQLLKSGHLAGTPSAKSTPLQSLKAATGLQHVANAGRCKGLGVESAILWEGSREELDNSQQLDRLDKPAGRMIVLAPFHACPRSHKPFTCRVGTCDASPMCNHSPKKQPLQVRLKVL